ncbi:histidine phosphatase family protein [Caulobacter sp. HMWF009]|nr:histidine phosphatase family protein [Caulobacter sp. HMWF009]PTT05089.1 histidine phosphatase family protein [Caulobacter sp. HMWF025]
MADAMPADHDLPAAAPASPGTITLARHGEPALSRKVRLNCPAYGEWWGRYEAGGIKPEQLPPASLVEIGQGADVVLVSTRRRAIESARAICDGRTFSVDDLFIEAPLPPPPWPAWVRMSPSHLGFFARFWWWFFNHHAGQETRAQAEDRADRAADLLIARSACGHDVLLVAHGFFNWMIARSLERKGLRKVLDEGHGYWSVKRLSRT